MKIIIIGCGRYGSLLANRLSEEKHSVVIVDRKETAFSGLDPRFGGFKITGDASELSVLRSAGIHSADCLLAMCDEDTFNLMVTQIAKFIFNVPTVIARIYHPSFEPIFRKIGIQIISPIELTLNSLLNFLNTNEEKPE